MNDDLHLGYHHDYFPALREAQRAAALSRRAPVSAQPLLGGAAGNAQPPRQPPSSVPEVSLLYRREIGRTEFAATPGLDDTAPAAAAVDNPWAAATTVDTEITHDRPQLRAASPQPPQDQDFSRLLQSTDQLAEQLQRASERLTYLTEYAGESAINSLQMFRPV